MRVNDANTRVRCNYPQLNSLLLYLSQLGREIVKTNISIFSFFFSFLLSFPVSRQSRSRMEKKKENKILGFWNHGGKERRDESKMFESKAFRYSFRGGKGDIVRKRNARYRWMEWRNFWNVIQIYQINRSNEFWLETFPRFPIEWM